MLTLAFAQIVWSIAFQWVEVTGGDNGILGVWPENWAASPASFYWLSLGVAALGGGGAARCIVFSPFGFALRATRDSPLRSEAIGIDAQAHPVDGLRDRRHRRRRRRRAVRLSQGQRVSRQPRHLAVGRRAGDGAARRRRDGVGRGGRRHRLQGADDLAGEPDRSVEAGARRRHRADRGGVPEGHRRHAGDDPESPPSRRRRNPRSLTSRIEAAE